jgi:hypothetical protein
MIFTEIAESKETTSTPVCGDEEKQCQARKKKMKMGRRK